MLRKEREQPMRSPVNWSILGLVIERPSYGYEIWKRFDRLYGDAMPVGSVSSIYNGLDALERRGYIEVEEVDEPRSVAPIRPRQPKPNQRATDRGISAYEDWIMAQAREHSLRSLQFARQLGAFAERPQIALEILRRYEQTCLDDRQARIPTSSEFAARADPGLPQRLASYYGRSMKTATLAWIASARQEFEALSRAQR